MDLHGKNVLVTGAGGFIGSHLVEELVGEGAKVKAFVHYNSMNSIGNLIHLEERVLQEVELVRGDITDGSMVRASLEKVDVVFHLAALIGIPYSYVAPRAYVDVNISGTLNILQGGRDVGVERVVHTSTSEVYGTALRVPIDETHSLQPQSPYAASKISADSLAESFYRAFDLKVSIVRPFNNYGPRQSVRAIIPTIIAQGLAAPQIALGALEPVRDFLFVKDTARGYIEVATEEACVGEVVNLGTGSGISIGTLAYEILDMLGQKKEVVVEDRRLRPAKSEVMELVCDISKAQKLCGWEPQWDLRNGLEVAVRFVEENLSAFKVEDYNI
tara:strand:- start:1388 stop:2377 length:990 start_codon:yes stop_codon:yes gene_type:complete